MRRSLLVMCLFSVSLLPMPTAAIVASASPIGTVSPNGDQVYRAFESPSLSDVETEWGDAYYLEFIGDRFDTAQDASTGFQYFVNYLPDALPEIVAELVQENMPGNHVEPGSPKILTVPQIGDDAFAVELDASLGLLADERLMILIIRNENHVLTATAATHDLNADLLTMLVSIVSPTLDRWALNDPIQMDEDGIRSGGIWNMVPKPNEVPDGFVLDQEYEEGPGPQRDQSVPSPISDQPLLPTTSFESQISEGEGTNSRLAIPFDATIRVILANDTFSADHRGQCEGQGRYSSLHEEGLAALKTVDGGEELVLTRGLQPGYVSYDLQLQADVCVFEINFRKVPPRAGYLLIAGDAPIARFTYDELSAGGIGEVVVEN